MYDNTFIIVTTDNGGMTNWAPNKKDTSANPIFPASAGSNYPLRGGKTTFYEGGVRSFAFISVGRIPDNKRNTRSNFLLHSVDLTAFILRAAHILPLHNEILKIDGIDMYNELLYTDNVNYGLRQNVPINIYNGGNSYTAIRFNEYKLIVDPLMGDASGWFDEDGDLIELPDFDSQNPIRLYNLIDDPFEKNDISTENSKLVDYGRQLIASYVISNHYLEPQPLHFFPRSFPNFHYGFWKPFLSKKDWEEKYFNPYTKGELPNFEELDQAILIEGKDEKMKKWKNEKN